MEAAASGPTSDRRTSHGPKASATLATAAATNGKMIGNMAAAGIDPAQAIPVSLDFGTDNEELLASNQYLGWPARRIRGDAYLALVGRTELSRAQAQERRHGAGQTLPHEIATVQATEQIVHHRSHPHITY